MQAKLVKHKLEQWNANQNDERRAKTEEQAETANCKLKRQSVSQNVKVQAEVSKHKLKCQSAEVQMIMTVQAGLKVKIQVEWSKHKLNGQSVS